MGDAHLARAPYDLPMSSPTAQPQPRPDRPLRVAVIAIHGVADQQAGDTARAVASLMVNAGGLQARYGRGDCDSFILAVPPLPPIVPSHPPEEDDIRCLRVDNGNGFDRMSCGPTGSSHSL